MKDGDFCPVYEAINLLQEKWTLHIVRSLLEGPKGFNELGRDIGGCNPTLDHAAAHPLHAERGGPGARGRYQRGWRLGRTVFRPRGCIGGVPEQRLFLN